MVQPRNPCTYPANAAACTIQPCRWCQTSTLPTRPPRQTKHQARDSPRQTRDAQQATNFQSARRVFLQPPSPATHARVPPPESRRCRSSTSPGSNNYPDRPASDPYLPSRRECQTDQYLKFPQLCKRVSNPSPDQYPWIRTSHKHRPGDRVEAAHPTAACCSSRLATPRRRCKNCTRCRCPCRTEVYVSPDPNPKNDSSSRNPRRPCRCTGPSPCCRRANSWR